MASTSTQSMSTDSPAMSSLASTSKPTRKKPPAIPELPPPAFSFKDANMDIILEDLSSRFILNLPDNELSSVERVCFQVEQAHWYYEDFIRQENPSLPSMVLRSFSAKLFAACPLLQRWSHRHEEAFNDFVKYKTSVPVCGAILLNSNWDKCVLVKGWKSNAPWGFPRGKINENEPLEKCAAREVSEETGYNCAEQIHAEAVITSMSKEQHVTLFVVPNVPEDYNFVTKTRKEISKIEWFYLKDLSGFSDEDDARNHRGFTQTFEPIRTWGVSPFLAQLKHRLLEFQILFGFMPPDLNPRQLKEYRRIQRNKAREAGRRRAEAARAEAAAIEAAVAEGESTGAEGDEEPETETDHDLHLSHSSGQFSLPSTTPAQPLPSSGSAIDALFTRTLIGAANNSSPDISSISPAKKGAKVAKSAKTPRAKQAQIEATPTPSSQDDEAAKEKAHFANLMQSLTLSQPSASTSQVTSSGLPTPADSPVVDASSKMSRTMTSSSAQSDISSLTTTTGNASSFNQKSMFDFVSPFDAFTEPSSSKKKPVTARPPAAAVPSWSSSSSRPSSNVTSGSDSFQSEPSSAELGAVLTSDDDGLDDTDTIGPPAPEAPATLTMPTRAPGGMMHRAFSSAVEPSKSSVIPPPRAATPDAALQFTPKAKQPPVMEDLSGPSSATTNRLTSTTSMPPLHSLAPNHTGLSTTAQHLALLDQVAIEADTIAQTPHVAPVGLPPAPTGTTGMRMGSQPGVVGNAHNQHPPPLTGQPFVGNMAQRAPSMGNPIAAEPYGQLNIQGYPPQPRSHIYNMVPPQLHHPLPHLHPQQLITIPSASPSPNLSTTTSGMPIAAAMAGYGNHNGSLANAQYSPQVSALQQQQVQPNPMQRQRHATESPNSQAFYQSPRNAMAPLAQTARPQTVVGYPAHLAGNYGRPHAANGSGLTSPRAAFAGTSPMMARPPLQPNPHSFSVQKTQAERNQLLDLFRSPPNPPINAPAPMVSQAPISQGNVVPNPAPAAGSLAPTMPTSAFDGGFIPANVQFRALSNRAARPGSFATSPSK